jgi:hypothetical protein
VEFLGTLSSEPRTLTSSVEEAQSSQTHSPASAAALRGSYLILERRAVASRVAVLLLQLLLQLQLLLKLLLQ